MNKKNSFIATRRVFSAQNGQQMRLRLGLRNGPRWGSLQRSPDPLAGLRCPTYKRKRREGKGEGKGKGRVRERKEEGGGMQGDKRL